MILFNDILLLKCVIDNDFATIVIKNTRTDNFYYVTQIALPLSNAFKFLPNFQLTKYT